MENKAEILEIVDDWKSLQEELVSNYPPGKLIPHSVLKKKLDLKEPEIKDFAFTADYIRSLEAHRLDYASMIRKLRKDILRNYKFYLMNDVGFGYRFMVPGDQVTFAHGKTVRGISDSINEGFFIANNRRTDLISQEQKAKDNELLIAMGTLKLLFSGAK